jgi:hypothetical protein
MTNTQVTDKIQHFYETHLQDMTRKHSQVLQTRFDLHYPQDESVKYDMKQITDFNENLKRDLERNYPLPKNNNLRSSGKTEEDKNKVDPRLIWVREQHDESPNCHYHCLALVNGKSKRSGFDIQKRAERQWNNALGLTKTNKGLVDFCNHSDSGSIMIDRNKDDYTDKIEDAKRQASYLSKSKGKENSPKGLWKVGGSRVPRD